MCIVNKLIVCFQKFPVLPPPYLRIRKNKIKNNVKYLIFDVGGEGSDAQEVHGSSVGKEWKLTLGSSPFGRVLLHILVLDF